MGEQDVGPPHLVAELADRLQERQRFDVADGPSHLGDHHVDVGVAAHAVDPLFDLVRDVGDDLDGVAEVVAPPLLLDDGEVHGAGGDVGVALQVLAGESLVVAEVEVGLGAVIGNEHLAVLERAHSACVDVHIRVQFNDAYRIPSRLHESADGCGSYAFSQAGDYPSRDKDIF